MNTRTKLAALISSLAFVAHIGIAAALDFAAVCATSLRMKHP